METQTFRLALADFIRAEARPVDKFSHQPRLYRLARRVGTDEAFDDDVLFAAAWLHDLGVFVGHRPEEPAALARWDNVAYALAQTPALLEQFGFPPEKIPSVLDAIANHQPHRTPATREGVILRDADILEQLGAIGILRTVSKVGRDTRFPTFADALAVLRKNLDTLPAQLRLDTARRLTEPRVRQLREFLAAAENEAGGEPL